MSVITTGGSARLTIDLSGVATLNSPSLTVGTSGTAPVINSTGAITAVASLTGQANTAMTVQSAGTGTLDVKTQGNATLAIGTNNVDRIQILGGGGLTINPTSASTNTIVKSNVNDAISVAGATGITTFSVPPRTSVDAAVDNDLTRLGLFTNVQTYNPVLSGGGTNLNSGNYTTRVGRYIQVGKLVWFQIRITISAKTGLSVGDLAITLPVAASSVSDLTQALSIGNITGMTTTIVCAFAQIPAGGSADFNIPIKDADSVGTANATTADVSTTFQIRAGGFYIAA